MAAAQQQGGGGLGGGEQPQVTCEIERLTTEAFVPYLVRGLKEKSEGLSFLLLLD
jgi:hypothetical protein